MISLEELIFSSIISRRSVRVDFPVGRGAAAWALKL
jgi:hypothetical protein